MSSIKIILLTIFAVVQILVLALSISAIVLPQWLVPEKTLILTTVDKKVQNVDNVTTVDKEVQYVDNVGLWQLCVAPFGTAVIRATIVNADDIDNEARKVRNSFQQLGGDDCKTGNIVEDFYRGNPVEEFSVFSENVYSEFMATRAMAILFVIFAIVKFFMVLADKCREQGGRVLLVISIVIAILEACSSAGALVAYGLILGKAVDQQDKIPREDYYYYYQYLPQETDVDIRDFWGLSYQLFLASAAIAVVADLAFCICW